MILFLLECQIETWGDCECVFPFKYNGVLYNSCTDVDEERLWCATDVNEDQEFIGDYGLCREGELNHTHLRKGVNKNNWGKVFRLTERGGHPQPPHLD